MSPLLRLSLLSAAAAVLFAGAASALVAAAYGRARPGLAASAPAARSWRILGWAALPWLGALALLALCFVPSGWSALGVAADHCPLHDDGHLHLCLAHAPRGPVSAAEVGLLLAAALAAGAVILRVLRAQLATWRAVLAVRRLAGGSPGARSLVPTSEPLSVTAGLLRPLVLVSTGLRDLLTPAHLGAVLAHERAHARRRDPLRLFAVALLGALHGPATRRLLLADMALACEQAADEAAAAEVGDRTLVAEAIVAVERLLWSRAPRAGLSPGMAGCATEERVEALLRVPLPSRPRRPGRAALLATAAVGALAAATEIHHLTESFLDLLAR